MLHDRAGLQDLTYPQYTSASTYTDRVFMDAQNMFSFLISEPRANGSSQFLRGPAASRDRSSDIA